MESIDNQIDEIVKENMIHRFASELQNTESDDRKKKLREILKLLQRQPEQNARDKINEMCDEVDVELLKRNWTKLTLLQKQDRIKTFVRSLKDNADKPSIESKLLEMLADGQLKSKLVDYDNADGKILSIKIPNLIPSDDESSDDNVMTDSSSDDSSDDTDDD